MGDTLGAEETRELDIGGCPEVPSMRARARERESHDRASDIALWRLLWSLEGDRSLEVADVA